MTPAERTRNYLLGFIAAVLAGAVLYFMRPVILPFVLAAFFAILVRPLHRLIRRHLPEWLSLTLVTLLVGLLLIAVPTLFAANIQAIVERLPDYAPRISALVDDLRELAAGMDIDLSKLAFGEQAVLDSLLDVLSASVQGAASFLGTVVIVLFIMIFVLTEADIVPRKLALMLPAGEAERVSASARSMRALLTQYVATKTLISFLSGLSAGLFTWALGIDFPFVWGVLTFTLYYIPNVGSMIAMVPPTLVALIQFDSPVRGLVALSAMVVAFNLIGNILEPRLLGRALRLSPLVVFLSLLFWGWYWGFVGVVLSVPLTVALKIVCEHVDALRPLAILMGDDPNTSRAVVSDRESEPAPVAGND